MGVYVHGVGFDANDPDRLATFWAAALGWRRAFDDGVEVAVDPPEGASPDIPGLVFVKVPEGKAAKNRVHLDLRPDDRDAEVARLESLGATRVDIGQGPDVTWVVMADPEGNEFCVLRARSA